MANNQTGDTDAGYKNDDSENGSDEDRDNKNEKKQTPVLEWIMAGIGFVLVVGVIGFVLYNKFNAAESPPDLIVVKENIRQVETGYLVLFKVKNAGNQTASQAVIKGSLVQNGKETETAQVTLDYVPPDSERKGGLYFSANPADSRLKLEAVGYEEP